jgi:hypothetical protein
MARSIFWVENGAAYFFHDADNFSQEGVVGAGLRGGRFFTSAEAFAIGEAVCLGDTLQQLTAELSSVITF